MKTVLMVAAMLLMSLTVCLGVVENVFSRYEIILQRKPFGESLAPVTPNQPTNSLTIISREIKIVGFSDNGLGKSDSIRVSFVNISAKPPLAYTLRVGEKSDDGTLELLGASYDEGWAQVRKDGQEQRLTLDEGAPSAPAAVAAGTPSPFPLSVGVPPPAATAADKRAQESYAERLRKRREADLQRAVEAFDQPPPQPKLTGDELKKHLEQYQMEAIRKGKPPLPIPLSQEMDDQLVKEGVLPPSQPAR